MCTECPGGRYGSSTGATSDLCTGACTAGYACPAGSTSPTASVCPAGYYSLAGAAECVACPAGHYSTAGAGACSACPGGTYGTGGSTSPACSGDCAAGYACPAGSSSGNAVPCLPGYYSQARAAECTACPGGKYGSVSLLSSNACSGMCTAGYYCPAGSVSPVPEANPCPAGFYSTSGATTCIACPGGKYGTGSPVATSAACTGECTAGYACTSGSVSATALACPAGYYSIAGQASCTQCPGGTYGTGSAVATSDACDGSCAAGSYSLAGSTECTLCPAGKFGSAASLGSAECSGSCSAGYYCPAGSIVGTPAGNQCDPGTYAAIGAGACSLCPAGRYGATNGLQSSSCTDACAEGRFGASGGATTSQCDGACLAEYTCNTGSTDEYGGAEGSKKFLHTWSVVTPGVHDVLKLTLYNFKYMSVALTSVAYSGSLAWEAVAGGFRVYDTTAVGTSTCSYNVVLTDGVVTATLVYPYVTCSVTFAVGSLTLNGMYTNVAPGSLLYIASSTPSCSESSSATPSSSASLSATATCTPPVSPSPTHTASSTSSVASVHATLYVLV